MRKLRRIALFFGLVMVAGAGTARAAAEEKFSTSIPAGEFSAAGLAKLSPEELARLDALVRDYKSGALEAARREAAAATEARASAEAKAARAETEVRAAKAVAQAQAAESAAKKSDGGLLAKAKVLLTPGTQVEYATVESRIAGEFRGWERRTTFTLENGQRWQATGDNSYNCPVMMNPAVKIVPGLLGSFWLTVEGVKQRAKVVPIGAK